MHCNGDIIFFGADKAKVVNDALGALRRRSATAGRVPWLFEDEWAPLWVVDFPMFEYDEEASAGTRCTTLHRAKDGPTNLMTTDRCLRLPRPTTWCSTAGNWAAARCVSTAPTCSQRCSPR